MTRYIIIGAGAVGGTIGGRLFLSDREVVLVARGAHLRALRQHGLRLSTPNDAWTLRIQVIQEPEELTARNDDVLILATKTQDSMTALDAWSGHGRAIGRTPPILLAQNG